MPLFSRSSRGKESEWKYKSVFNNTTDGIVMVPNTNKVPEKTNKVTQYKMDNPRSLEIGKI